MKNKTSFQSSTVAQLLAIALGPLLIYWLAFRGGVAVLESDGILMPTIVGSLEMVVIETVVFGGLLVALLYLMCGDNLASLQQKAARLESDVSGGITLSLLLLGTLMLFGYVLMLFQSGDVPAANVSLAKALADNPLLLAIWLGPVIVIKAAFLEEFTRVFFLTRLWKIWGSPRGKEAGVVLAAILFGLGHIYQGAVGVAGTAIIGYILGKAYLKGGRFLPLVIGHALYDITVLATLVALVGSGTLDTQ